ncbi:ribosomal protein S5 family protein [Artemisia annua]|uniref:40S ribosomal protein S2 n=1 Tax=Artemisia annua TaxID=35608 RepID=A0A2U1N7R3_ARTAN|nr:ribosomal protein S5 family protein [Artemisia annua]
MEGKGAGGDHVCFAAGFGVRGGDRGRGGDRRDPEEQEWVPVTKLGRLVKDQKITKLEEIYLESLPLKEHEIVDKILPSLKAEVISVKPVGSSFEVVVVVGDGDGHVGLGFKRSKEVATAMRGALILAKLSVVPVKRGYWGNKLGKAHTVPTKLTGIWVGATFDCLLKTHCFVSPDLCKKTRFLTSPLQECTDVESQG